ncbi:uncharacterized protein E6C27_scaffold773G00310 [Cucumis melo var. makuwa]|uniref:Uncharacterized protein n=1 Tax=Cucumis melo var. makuwa TaxID=1194695 RepID=A0A5A7UA88_CUCMM|nr:uncharacterized protein E6C27_scaffold773G00310 [Cucumis melo var. makuwa]
MNYNYQGKHPPQNLVAVVAQQNSQYLNTQIYPSNAWLADSGCNALVTANFGNLYIANGYSGEDSISVASGQSLPITHT